MFQSLATEDNRESLQEIIKTGNAIKRIKDINKAKVLMFLADLAFTYSCRSFLKLSVIIT